MSTTVEQAFETQFESEVKLDYQQCGSKLRNTVRLKSNVKGKTDRFKRMGRGEASTKTRHGRVPVMNASHSYVDCTLTDFYAGDWVDKLDELKVNHDERQVQAKTGSAALGRKIDALIIEKLDTTTNLVAEGSAGLTKAKILTAFETLNNSDVPDDGERYGIVGAHQWNELLAIQEFASSDYVGKESLPWLKGVQAKRWLNIMWLMHTGLPLGSGTRSCFLYHKAGIGLAEGMDIKVDITWNGPEAAFFVDTMMSAGACLIDSDGVIEIACDDDAAIS